MTHTNRTHIHIYTTPISMKSHTTCRFQSIFGKSPPKYIIKLNANKKKLESITEENEDDNSRFINDTDIIIKNTKQKFMNTMDTIYEHDEIILFSRQNIKISQV
jgi:hypothetical protein